MIVAISLSMEAGNKKFGARNMKLVKSQLKVIGNRETLTMIGWKVNSLRALTLKKRHESDAQWEHYNNL